MADGGCSQSRCQPIWPSNTSNELLYNMQRLFSRDNHNHDQVLGEQTYNLPLLLPENQAPFKYVNSLTGQVEAAPYSTDNIMHVSWVPYRLGTNLNTPWGSDSDIYFDKVPEVTPSAPISGAGYSAWKDWLDVNAAGAPRATIDEKVAATCSTAGECRSNGGLVCTQTCVDWWTNRIVNPQGSLMPASGVMGGGCPHGTLRALNCYPCHVHNTYVRGQKLQ